MPSRKESKTAAAWKQVGVESDLDGLTLGSAQQDERRETITAQERNTQASNGKATKQQQLNEIQERVVEERDTAMIDAEDRAADPTRSRATTPASDAETVSTEQLSECQPDHTLPRLPRSTFVEVPVLARYELRDLPSDGQGKFGNDQGIFATQDIKQGMRIMSERPILTLMAPGDQLDELMAAYNRLPKTDQKRIWNLRPATPDASDQLHTLRYLTDRLAADLSNLLLKLRSDRTEEEQAVLDKMTPKLENAMTVWRIAARWHLNRCSMTNLPMEHRSSLPTGTPITGLFIERAQIRHSCVPNCFASFDANLDRMNVHVVRDIAAGEELTLAAFADSNYYHTAADRREELAAWGLTCNCEACDETHPRFRVHESARQRAHARAVLLNDMLTRLENEELPEPDLETAQSVLLSLIRDLKLTHCDSAESVRWRNILVDRVLPARALLVADEQKLIVWRVVLSHTRECEKLGRICFGEDSAEYEVLRKTREGTEAVVGVVVDAEAEAEMREE